MVKFLLMVAFALLLALAPSAAFVATPDPGGGVGFTLAETSSTIIVHNQGATFELDSGLILPAASLEVSKPVYDSGGADAKFYASFATQPAALEVQPVTKNHPFVLESIMPLLLSCVAFAAIILLIGELFDMIPHPRRKLSMAGFPATRRKGDVLKRRLMRATTGTNIDHRL